MLFELLKSEFATSTFLYVGYSNNDPNWKTVVEEIISEFYPSRLPQSFRVAPSTDRLDEEILRSKGIDTIPSTYDEFSKNAAIALEGSTVPADILSRIKTVVPADLQDAFERNPAAVARLLQSWEYVNQAQFTAAPNAREFFRGDKANWGLIAGNIAFERDLEDEIYDYLLDYATGSAKRPSSATVLAPAGYGTTTLIRMVAARLVKDRAGMVFLHKEGTPLAEGDIEYAASLSSDACPFFIIDNAADYETAIFESIQRLRDTEKRSLFLLGEHLNEWRFKRRGRSPGREFIIEPLSDPEIDRLLGCLEAQNELNKLTDLNYEMRFAAIKQNYQKELLVALREATEGKAFDAILEDEFRSIPTQLAQQFYLVVCCFYQHGAFLRDTLLAEMLEMPLENIYKETAEATAGITIFEEVDPSYGRYAVRARHRKIAAVVWERCASPGEQERIILKALSNINLNYRTDAKAFEDFVRSDRPVDNIRTLEGRTRFFEQACQKDPLSPYVRQHYARMLNRSNQMNLALGQIDEGLKLDNQLRVLHHTKGVVLQKLAMSTGSIEIGRRRLVQSEDEFKTCIRMNDRDEYAYQGLASLYVDWAERVSDETESAEYLSRAEEVISEGLRRVRVRDGLWIVSSRIQRIFGNKLGFIAALEKAVSEATGSIIAKYLLARAYRESGNQSRAISILKPVLEAQADEFRASIECACALWQKVASRMINASHCYG